MTVYIRVVNVPATHVESECQLKWADWVHTHSCRTCHNTWPVLSRFSSLDGIQRLEYNPARLLSLPHSPTIVEAAVRPLVLFSENI